MFKKKTMIESRLFIGLLQAAIQIPIDVVIQENGSHYLRKKKKKEFLWEIWQKWIAVSKWATFENAFVFKLKINVSTLKKIFFFF